MLAGPNTQRLLLPGDPAAHGPDRLPLLPSGPDGVQQRSIAQDLTINTANCEFGDCSGYLSTRNSTPL
ncbi:uncharacterized protein METZ01_LOCUS455631 [marine metagenome]|uniref:Uncharacterized protein n=1 Tax=marine metagenome TaxID=408172 RepID=A0A383A4P1_9ZZZZ